MSQYLRTGNFEKLFFLVNYSQEQVGEGLLQKPDVTEFWFFVIS